MKRRISAVLVATLAFACLAIVGCSGSGSPAPTEEPTLSNVEVEWNGYTMGIDQVTDDQEIAVPTRMELDGKAVKVCFYYISDENNSTGFVAENMLTDLGEIPIVLKDSEGNVYKYTGSMSDFIMKGDFATSGFSMEEIQPRFSITFDIPTDIEVEDLTLETGDGQKIKLIPYTSEAYEADHPAKD